MSAHIVTGPYHGESYSLWYIVRLDSEDGEEYTVLESRNNREDAEECADRLNRAGTPDPEPLHATGQYCECEECSDRLIEAHQEDRGDWSSRLYRGAR